MGHFIQAIIGSDKTIDCIATTIPQFQFVRLLHGCAMIPVSAELIDSICTHSKESTADINNLDKFTLLTPKFQTFLLDLSRHGPIAYLETEYFGGDGGQGAMVIDNGQLLMQPEWSKIGPINSALSFLGVKRNSVQSSVDEFSLVGLGQYRSNDDWLESNGLER